MTAEVDREKHLSSAYGQRGARFTLSGNMPLTDITREDTKGSRCVKQPSWRTIEFRCVTTTWPWTGLPHSYGHGPQLASSASRSDAPTVPFSSKSAGQLPPVREQNEQIARSDGAIVVQVRWAVAAVSARTPVRQQD